MMRWVFNKLKNGWFEKLGIKTDKGRLGTKATPDSCAIGAASGFFCNERKDRVI